MKLQKNAMSDLQLTISNQEINRKGKLVLINQYLKRGSGKETIYSCDVADGNYNCCDCGGNG